MRFEDYLQLQTTYQEFAETLRFILDKAIVKTPGCPHPQSIQARAKDPDKLKLKLEGRQIIDSDSIEEEIKDLAGARLIFYTSADVDRFNKTRLISDNFIIHREETRVHQPISDDADQKYRAIHYTVSLKPERCALPEYAKFEGLRCEIQIQTVLDHAWAEINHVLYKKPESIGFGTRAWSSIEKRMNRIMDEYLLPAGHDLRKVQYDYERLMEGKRLFDRGTLESLSQSQDNNERYDILSSIKEYVLPNYDDIEGIYPDLCQVLISTASKSKETETKPIETSFGAIRGKTFGDILKVIAEIVEELRYINVSETFDCLVALYQIAENSDEQELLLKIAESFADYNLNILKQVGYHVQTKLVKRIKELSVDDHFTLQPLITTMLGKLLHSEVSGVSWTHDTASFSRGAVMPNEDVRLIKEEAISVLLVLLDAISDVADKKKIILALNSATRLPINYTEEVCILVIGNAKEIVEKLTDRIPHIPFQLLEQIEHHFWLLYRRTKGIIELKTDWDKLAPIAEETMNAILKFRDVVNEEKAYVKYKTLVGFDGVFDGHWKDEDFDGDAYRKECAKRFAREINEDNKEEWYDFIKICVATQSDDLATFPIFGEFLYELAKANPDIATEYIERSDDAVLNFLASLLAGIADGGSDGYSELTSHLISKGDHLGAIAIHFKFTKDLPINLLEELAGRAVSVGDRHAAIQLVSLSVMKHEKGVRTLIDKVFNPMMLCLNQNQDARWVRVVGYLKDASIFFKDLTYDETCFVIDNLVYFPEINYDLERVLAPIAERFPDLIWKLFAARLKKEKDNPEILSDYDALPHEFHMLHVPLSAHIDEAIQAIRSLYKPDDPLFEFNGGALIHAIFPRLEEPFVSKLIGLVGEGGDENIEFVLGVLKNYRGDISIHPVIKEIIEQLPENDPLINGVELCLLSTGVVSGEFGMVEAYKEKRESVKTWLSGESSKIIKFATQFIDTLTQMMASEQRRSEQQLEARKRDFGDDEGK